jgi:hypothetical protein
MVQIYETLRRGGNAKVEICQGAGWRHGHLKTLIISTEIANKPVNFGVHPKYSGFQNRLAVRFCAV